MTDEEIRAVIAITNKADSGCSTCARALAEYLGIRFPEHQEAITEAFNAEHSGELDFTPEPPEDED